MNKVIHTQNSFVNHSTDDRTELKKHESIVLDICNELGIPEPSNREIKEEIIPQFNIDVILAMNTDNKYREYVKESIR